MKPFGPVATGVQSDGDGSWSYDETVTIEHARVAEVVAHTDRSRMRRGPDPH